MKNMKKSLVMIVSLVLIAAIALGGTIAYLTVDPVKKSNIFTVGDIAIELNEETKVIGEGGTVTSDDNGATYENVMPGDYLKKEVSVKNTGTRPAYVAVEVTFNNALAINNAIDEFYEGKGYSTDEIQTIYDFIFDGFGLNYTKTDAQGNDTGMRLTITGDDMPEGVMQVDSVKTISEYWQQYSGNWFLDEKTKVDAIGDLYNGYYTTGMEDYQIRYTYYMLLEEGNTVTLFKGFNVPASFNAEQLKMFKDMKIDIVASAIQADNMENAKDAISLMGLAEEDVETAKKAFSILKAEYADNINDGDVPAFEFKDEWDGTADTSWYNDTDTEFTLVTAEQLAGLADLVDAGNTFEGKTVKLGRDIDLKYVPEGTEEPKSFDPIGDDSPFAGTFDGQGHTIENLYQSGWAFGYEWGKYGSIGLFGEIDGATVKNLNISGAYAVIEGGDIGGITGSATGNCSFENITISNSGFGTYNNGLGGIIGWSGAGNYTFKNIDIKSDVVLGGLWGSFDSSIGGVVGQGEPGATYNFENVDIACRLDAYNDCTASYDYYNYRMCGMIIGRLAKTTTIDGVNYPDMSQYNITCDNVTVTYGSWANYHYCRAAGARGVRVEAGFEYGGIAADYDHSICTVHHMELIPFDQIFGGDQYGVKGLKEYTGVTVIYNNK